MRRRVSPSNDRVRPPVQEDAVLGRIIPVRRLVLRDSIEVRRPLYQAKLDIAERLGPNALSVIDEDPDGTGVAGRRPDADLDDPLVARAEAPDVTLLNGLEPVALERDGEVTPREALRPGVVDGDLDDLGKVGVLDPLLRRPHRLHAQSVAGKQAHGEDVHAARGVLRRVR